MIASCPFMGIEVSAIIESSLSDFLGQLPPSAMESLRREFGLIGP